MSKWKQKESKDSRVQKEERPKPKIICRVITSIIGTENKISRIKETKERKVITRKSWEVKKTLIDVIKVKIIKVKSKTRRKKTFVKIEES